MITSNFAKIFNNNQRLDYTSSHNQRIGFGSSRLITLNTTKSCVESTNLALNSLICDHETYFFRYPQIIRQLCKHVQTKFPNGSLILNPFSSVGEEAKTISMMLANKKHQIVGIDLFPEVVIRAKANNHEIAKSPYIYKYGESSDTVIIEPSDKFLLQNESLLTTAQKLLKMKFFKYFNLTKSTEDRIQVEAKDAAFENIKFLQGNIANIAEIAAEQQAQTRKPVSAVIAQNGFYHILQNNKKIVDNELILSRTQDCNLTEFEKIIKEIHRVLDNDGVLVYGSLDRDHLTMEDLTQLKNQKFLHQLQRHGNRYKSSQMHKILQDCGFEPLHYAKVSTPIRAINSDGKEQITSLSKLGIQVPCIFKKST